MARDRVLAVVLAGGKGSRLQALTQRRAKPAVPYGGTHRLIDFALSNCAHSGIDNVWVIQQYNPESITDHLAGGRPWDLDRTQGGLLTLHPRQTDTDDREGFAQGTAHSLWQQVPLLREFDPSAIVVVSADAVYRLDYQQVVADHRAHDAEVTMVTTQVEPDDASRYGIVEVADSNDPHSVITSYAYKPEHPTSTVATNEVFVFSPDPLLDLLDDLGADQPGDQDDLGHHILPRLVARGRARQWRFDGYWRDVGTVQAYWRSHQDLLGDEPAFCLRERDWPILTRGDLCAPVRVGASAQVETCLLASGAVVNGTVRHSVVGRGATVHPGAVVEQCVLLPGSVVEPGAVLHRAIVDEQARIGSGARIGAPDGEITLIASNTHVPAKAHIKPGQQYPAAE